MAPRNHYSWGIPRAHSGGQNEMDSGQLVSLPDLEVPDDLGLKTAEEAKYEELVRELVPLEASDIDALKLCGPSRSMSGLQHLRVYHRVVALKLAMGDRPVAIAASLGLQPSTISRLQKNQQFQQLVDDFSNKLVDKAIDHFELMEMISGELLIAMHEKLTADDRGDIPLESLRRTAETILDRTGHSPVRRSETLSRVQHELGTQTIERIRQLHSENTTYEAPAIEATAVSVHEEESADSGAAGCISGAFEPVAEDKANGKEGRRSYLPAKGVKVPEEGT